MQIVLRISTSPKDNYDSDVGVSPSASLREYTMDRRSIIGLCAMTLGVMHEVGRSWPVRLLGPRDLISTSIAMPFVTHSRHL